jgi:hypothetical protein
MKLQAIQKLSDADLLALIKKCISEVTFTPEDALALNRAIAVAKTRRSIFLGMGLALSNRVTAPIEALTPSDALEKSVEINLTVLDKESVPEIEGLKKYVLGYALDSTKPFDGENMLRATEVILPVLDFKVGAVVGVAVANVKPFMNGRKLYEIELGKIGTVKPGSKPHSSKEIIRKAHAAGCLDVTQETAIGLNKNGILKIDIDKQFGIPLDKTLAFKKGQNFGKHGVVYSVIYPANEVDTDGDSADPEQTALACWNFMKNLVQQGNGMNFMHEGGYSGLSSNQVIVVECAVALADAPALGIKKDDWYGAFQVLDPEIRKLIEAGTITGVSIEGTAVPGGN